MNSDKRPELDAMNPSPTGWRKSSHSSANANCVEVNPTHPQIVSVRDSKDHGTGPMINMTRRQWAMFVDQVTSTTEPITV